MNYLIVGGAVAGVALAGAMSLRKVPEADEAVVITHQGKMMVLSGHPEHRYSAEVVLNDEGSVISTKRIPHNKVAYYAIPSSIPFIGRQIQKMPLNMIEISVPDFETFDEERAKFNCDVKAYLYIKDVMIAAKRFPGNMEELKSQVGAVIQGATRQVTTTKKIREILVDREGIRDSTREKVKKEVDEWGLELSDLEILDFKDAKGSSVITDISSIKHAEINSEARQKNAEQHKSARLKEAETEEDARKRELQKDENVGVREKTKNQNIAIEDQKAQTELMKVLQINTVRKAEIEKEALIQEAEGKKQALIMDGEGKATAQKLILFAEAEGLSMKADAMEKINTSSLGVREIEMREKVGIELAKAYQDAEIKVIQAGDKPQSLMDFATAGGGANVGAALSALNATNPEVGAKISKLLDSFTDKKK